MKDSVPETRKEDRVYEEARIPEELPETSTLPENERWLHDIFLVRKLTKAPLLFSTGITCILITDKSHPVEDETKAHWLTEIARREAIFVRAFCWEFPEGYEFPPELKLNL